MKLTVADAAAMLGVDERAIYRWIRENEIPFHRVNDQYRFQSAELLEWGTARGLRVSSTRFRERVGGGASSSLLGALTEGGVHHEVEGSDRESVLRAIVDLMPIEKEDTDLLYDFLLARETLGSTGIGDGIAIPHVRAPIVVDIERPAIVLSFLAKPVEFQSIDGKPVSALFTLVTTSIRAHLYLLSRLAAALHDSTFKAAVLRQASQDEIFTAALGVEGAEEAP